jgi:hypothetical protein
MSGSDGISRDWAAGHDFRQPLLKGLIDLLLKI